MLGTNDSKTYNWNADDYAAGLKELVESYKALDSNPTVYLMRSPYCFPINGADTAEYEVQDSIVNNELADIIYQVANEEEVEVIDLYSATVNKTDLYTDGIHFNAEGYSLISATIYDFLKEKY